jgi:Cap4 SAVED domain
MNASADSCSIQNAQGVTEAFLDQWLIDSVQDNITVFTEKNGSRAACIPTIVRAFADHFRDVKKLEERIARLGFSSSIEAFRNAIPTDKKTRSGDLGEVFCTEYIMQKTDFKVPVKKLRWKDDRDRTMRGNDVLGFRVKNRVSQILKAESKSRASLSNSVVLEAEQGLLQHDNRPNPSTLSFIQERLDELGRSEEADFIAQLQESDITLDNIQHLFFTVSGNPPLAYLSSKKDKPPNCPRRVLVGFQIAGHQEFIKAIYEACLNGHFRTDS